MTPEEAQRAQVVVTFLNQLVPAAWAFFVECHNAPAEGSFLERAKKDSDVGEQTYGELSARAHGTPWAMVSGTTPVEKLGELHRTTFPHLWIPAGP